MIEVTIGYVAGFIAAAVVVAQIWCPTIMALVIAGLLRDTETVATWNIASRVLQRTWWPTILASDSVLTHGARFKITLISWAVPSIAVLIAITSIVTPLGLYEQMDTLGTRVGSFAYIKDLSSFGSATSQRGVHDFSRICSWVYVLAPCPYSENRVMVTSNGTNITVELPYGYSSRVSPIVREIFSSGTTNLTTISNFFDIEWRQLTTTPMLHIDNGTEVPVGLYRQLESHIMDSTITVVEGLVVDGIAGGVGFRNHTIPKNIERGASWSEDLLFIEPIASCVNTNLTLDFEILLNKSSISFSSITNLRLTDRGGFVDMNKTYPSYDRDNAQSNPDLRARAYRAAWLNNALTMQYFNVTTNNSRTTGQRAFSYLDSKLGKEFVLEQNYDTDYRALGFSSNFGNYLDLRDSYYKDKGAKWLNPFNVTSRDFGIVRLLCSGAGGADFANISNIYVGCGMVRGVPQRVDSGDGTIFDNHSKWSSSIHACAAALTAVVKTVNFSFDGTRTDGLDGLIITSITNKSYDNPDEFPVWGMEDSGLTLADISPVWGLLSPEYALGPNISTVKQPAFHLPGYSLGSGLRLDAVTGGNLPGSNFPLKAMNALFDSDSDEGVFSSSWPFDLRGAANMPVFKRWQALSNDSERIADIIKLVWTDIAASAVVGTKGTLGPGNIAAADKAVTIFIKPTGKRIKYRWVFGIPAFVLLLVMLVVTSAVLLCTAVRASSIAVLRRRLQQLTVGRILTTFLYPEDSNLFMSSKEWSHSNGHKAVSLGTAPRKGSACETTLQSFRHRPETPIDSVVVGLMGGDGKPRN
ncbi:hypothetical protein CDEST_15448 [Colletotrichum destructivum]|uniref:Uncharacterized protein n=1 Tax=Colletotrichum destructivum TaxID=34406 RepID=A0AAX4J4B5_9PEZI|nr:hypothetical protein CDEST_15448 [Colletotrichum destructivum]